MKYQQVWFKSVKENKGRYVMVPDGFIDRLACLYMEAKTVYGFDTWCQVNNNIRDNPFITDALRKEQQMICIQYAINHIVWMCEEQA